METVPAQLRAAAGLLWINAVGFGVSCLPAIRKLLAGRASPYVLGFPAYGRGPFERVGIPTAVPLLGAFLLVCILSGTILALALLPAGAFFWWGFALRIPPIFALIRTILILLNWQSLH